MATASAASTNSTETLRGREFEPRRHVVIGLGGIGHHVLRLLAQFLHSRKRRLTILAVDGDTFEPGNKTRMQFRSYGPKARVLVEEVGEDYGDVLTLLPVEDYVTPENIASVVGPGDVVLCQPDNHMTRRLVEQRCAELDDVVLFSGGNDGVEDGNTGTYGNVQVYLRAGGIDLTNPISRFHPEIAQPADKLPTDKGCAEQQASAPQLLFTNLAVASAMLAAYFAWTERRLAYEEVYLDILPASMVAVSRKTAARAA